MKILVISPVFLPTIGGAEIVMLEVFRRIAEEHDVTLVTPTPKEELGVYSSDEYNDKVNFKVIRFKDKWSMAKLRGHRVSGGLLPPFSLSAVAAVRKSIREDRPDVINLHYVVPTGLAAMIGKLFYGVPLVVTYNGRDVPGPGVPWFWKYWNKLVGFFADEVTFVSNFCRHAVFGKKASLGQVIYNGVNVPEEPLQERCAAKKQLGISEDQKMIFSVGRLDKIKRVDVLIRAMSLLKEKYPQLLLYIAGKGPEKEKLQKLVEDLEMQSSIKLVGYIPSGEIGKYFLASEFFVFHSRFETFGMVLAEAMSYGRACVSVDTTAIPETAPDGDCALIARTMDERDMAEKISVLLENDEMRIQLEKNAIQRVRNLFDWDKIAIEYEKVFLNVAKKN